MLLVCSPLGCIIGKKNFTAKPSKNINTLNLIKMDGSYVGKDATGYICFLLYKNGVALLYDPIYHLSGIETLELAKKQILATIDYKDSRSKKKESGGFAIKENIIHIQIFRRTPGGIFGLCEYKGKIINDSTIHIDTCKFPENPNFCRDNFYLQLIKMNKPDSTNQLMDKGWYWQK